MIRHRALVVVMAGLAVAGLANAEDLATQREVSADVHGQVFIDNVAGSIVVSGWDRPNVAANAQVSGEGLRLSVVAGAGQTHVRIEGYGSGAGFIRKAGDARLTVWVPRDSQLAVTGVSADIRSRGVTGPQHLQAVSGDVDAEVFAAAVDVRSVSGDIRLHGHGQPAHITANSVSGDVRLSQGAGDVQATSISGNLQLGIDPAAAVHLRTTSGDITIEGGLAPEALLDINTVSGRIDLQAGAPAGFSYDISSFSGDIHDCFGQQAEHVAQFGPGTRLSGSRGAARSSLRIRTLSGDVSLCDRAPHRP